MLYRFKYIIFKPHLFVLFPLRLWKSPEHTRCRCRCVCDQLCLTLRPHGLQPTRLLCPWDSPSKNTGVACHFFFQGIFPIQGSNPCLLHWQADSLLLNRQRSPISFIYFQPKSSLSSPLPLTHLMLYLLQIKKDSHIFPLKKPKILM